MADITTDLNFGMKCHQLDRCSHLKVDRISPQNRISTLWILRVKRLHPGTGHSTHLDLNIRMTSKVIVHDKRRGLIMVGVMMHWGLVLLRVSATPGVAVHDEPQIAHKPLKEDPEAYKDRIHIQ